MSFWEAVGKVALKTYQAVGEKAQEFNEQTEAYQKSFRGMDDRRVMERYNKNGLSFAEKAACHLELEARGYLEKNEDKKYERTDKKIPT